jgi:hypothetical protein
MILQTEQDIEVWAERAVDRLDSKYTKGQLTTDQYKEQTKALYEEIKELYKQVKISTNGTLTSMNHTL